MAFPTQPLTQLPNTSGAVHALAYSSGAGTYILAGSHRTITLYNPFPSSSSHSSQQIQTYSAHGHEILDLSITAGNDRFASVGGDRQVFLWDVRTAQTLRRWGGHGARVNAVAWAGEDSVVISGGYDASVRLWDTKSRNMNPIEVWDEAKDSVTSVVVCGPEIIVGGVDGKVRTYDVRMGVIKTDVIGYPVTSLSVTRDGSAMLVSTLPLMLSSDKPTAKILLLDRATGKLMQTFTGHGNDELRIRSSFGANEKYVISGTEDGKIVVWDLLKGKIIRKLQGQHGEKVVSTIAWCERRGEWASAGGTGTICVWGSAPKA
ncbi:MAG: hypothetical protein M1814_005073 [Vezdaea aestivalis]|nr:MAG: hypothetical protein M1814_005073 [Vezdaea aestivalis]